jgi:hypothetical protein
VSAAVLAGIAARHPFLGIVMDRFDALGLPDAWLVAGAVAQSVWNDTTGRPPAYGLKDLDIVYFDDADLSQQAEAAHEARLRSLFPDLAVALDVKNEARVHLWYGGVFGRDIDPYRSVADAIATFPATATCVGIRPGKGTLDVCAPHGLDDLLGGIVRPNKRLVTPAVYAAKAARWRALWPELTYIGWDDAV